MPSKRPHKPGRRFIRRRPAAAQTAWDSFGKWYNKLVGEDGHYYHKNIILPGVLRLMAPQPGTSWLDLGCGQGIVSRGLPDGVTYWGIDAAPKLIAAAKQLNERPSTNFHCADASKKLGIAKRDFDYGSVILAMENIEDGEGVIRLLAQHLRPGARLILVLNHPCFRIPRQSSWETDEVNKIRYRRLNRYLTPMSIPMQVHPGKGELSPVMWAFHRPLTYYFGALAKHGFNVVNVEEWISDKESQGKAARMENRARSEFPLFIALLAERRPLPH
ncbi:MAG: class I SAM-dependent methyltransferase [Bdellovibrionaceae bacterium]|nr:class I SAM-dependent methyltransferase [Pseudobdellovibrionaceae bacterium]